MTDITLREILSDAIWYWECARLLYNVVLAAIVAALFFLAWPESKAALSLDTAQTLFVLAVLANVAFCSAYVVDVFVQHSELRATWLHYRWVLFVVGLLFAGVLANFISSGLFHTQTAQRY